MKNIYKILDPRSEEKDLHVACSVKTKKTTVCLKKFYKVKFL